MNTDAAVVGLGRRLGARVIDALILLPILLVAQLMMTLSDSLVVVLLGVVIYLAGLGFAVWNQMIRVGLKGQSIGKQVLGIRVLGQDTRTPVGVGRGILRDLVHGLLWGACWIVGIVNVVVMAKDPRRQGWHDKAVRSVVVPAATTAAAPQPAAALPAMPPGPPPPYQPGQPLPPGQSAQPTYQPAQPAQPTYQPAQPPAAPPVGAVPHPAAPAPAAPHSAPAPDARTVTSPGQPQAAAPGMIGPPPGFTSPPPEPPEAAGDDRDTVIAPRAGQGWRLTTPSGEIAVVDGLLLVGRDPNPELAPEAKIWRLDDPELTVSKTHALMGLDDGVAWVEDWNSTNGVALRRGVAELVLESRARTPLRDGDVIEFGTYKVSVAGGA